MIMVYETPINNHINKKKNYDNDWSINLTKLKKKKKINENYYLNQHLMDHKISIEFHF